MSLPPSVRSLLTTPGVYPDDTPSPAAVAPVSGVPVFLGYGEQLGADVLAPVMVSSWAEFQRRFDRSQRPANAPPVPFSRDAFLAGAVRGFFDGNGGRAWIVLLGDSQQWEAALRSLDELDDFDLVCAPGLVNEVRVEKQNDGQPVVDPDGRPRILMTGLIAGQLQVLSYCSNRRSRTGGGPVDGEGPRLAGCFAILDPAYLADAKVSISSQHARDLVEKQRDQLVWIDPENHELGARPTARNGALYYPCVRPTADTLALLKAQSENPDLAFVVPSGHVAGVYASTDRSTGPFKAPANAVLDGIVDLADLLTDDMQAGLTGVNCLRAFPGRGIRVWGARTLLATVAPAAVQREPWAHSFVNVQRLFITVRRWLESQMAWVVHEPHNLNLWNRITRQLDRYLNDLYLGGALRGQTAEEAFFVKCDAETNPADVRASGRLVVEIGLAPIVPGEFIVVRLSQSASGGTVAAGI